MVRASPDEFISDWKNQFWKFGLLKDDVIRLSRQGIKAVTGGIWYFPRIGTWNRDEEKITPKKVPTSIVQNVRAAKEPPEWPSITVFILYSVLKSIHWNRIVKSYNTGDGSLVKSRQNGLWFMDQTWSGIKINKLYLVEMNRFNIESTADTSILRHVNGNFSSIDLCDQEIRRLL